jgi:hypothetical protein
MAKTFAELFAGTGIEPTTDKDGGVHYNFNATLKNKPMKLYTEEQVIKAYKIGHNDGHTGVFDCSIEELSLTPIELPSDEEVNEKANSLQDEKDGDLYNEGINEGFYLGVEYMQQQILNQTK